MHQASRHVEYRDPTKSLYIHAARKFSVFHFSEGGNHIRETGTEQKNGRGQTAEEFPDLPANCAMIEVCRMEERVGGMSLNHHQYGECPHDIQEKETIFEKGRVVQRIIKFVLHGEFITQIYLFGIRVQKFQSMWEEINTGLMHTV